MTPENQHQALARDDWYVACDSRRLGRGPVPFTLMDTPLVLYRDQDGKAAALLDRCAHRNVPLSLGRVRENNIECAYHGWQFDASGDCRAIPGLGGRHEAPGRRVPVHAVRESGGFVWVYATADVEPTREPFRFELLGERGYTTVRSEVRVAASVFNTAENALDVPHTAYLHGGLFRSSRRKRNEIEVVVRRWHDRVEAEYVGEARPPGVVGRLLAPRSGVVTHYDRFILPSIVQVEYKLGTTHIVVSTALTPVSDHDTRLFAVISFRAPVPGWLVTPFLAPLGRRIFAQDARMLERQTETIRRFGGEHFTTTEIDILGPHVYRLLRQAEKGEREPVEKPFERTVRLLV
jgi:phenylpropionate dioxygenase-like ring-hydroxylating dioxygenase large terminal subunit